jgi:ribonuclease HI
MTSTLKILQANVWKSSTVQDAMYNDPGIWECDLVLIQEPHYRTSGRNTYVTGTGPIFEAIIPKTTQGANQERRIRSCIWANRSNEYTQILTDSNDITIVILQKGNRSVLVASVYIPGLGQGEQPDEQELISRLKEVQGAFRSERERTPELELFVAGDFNRHDSLWGGDRVAREARQGSGSQILDFMEDNDLQLLTPRGMVTWEQRGQSSTIDLALATERPFDDRITCQALDDEYGSDHRAILSTISIEEGQEEPQAQKYILAKANWLSIRNCISQSLQSSPFPIADVELMQDYIQRVTQEAIAQHCPKAKPSKYAERWWSENLTVLRRRYTTIRNQARSTRRQGRRDLNLEAATKAARHDFHHAITKKKKEHWTEFLGDATNIWQASRYLDPDKTSSFGRIAAIKKRDGETTQEKAEMARELLLNFFPEPPVPQQPEQSDTIGGEQLCTQAITLEEVEAALFSANPDRAPGIDGLTIRVWREVWPVLQQQIWLLFSTSLRQGKMPSQWKVAKIIPLKKASKDDYTIPKNYRPISLLATLGKIMESVIATRIAYFTEVHRLLPNNHFGARKQKSTIHALSYLQESIFDAWRGGKTLSLVSFDVKGAYNNVATGPLLERLRKRRIPEVIVRWVQEFCTGRRASVVVNGFASEVEDLPQSGLPQGSPLAPILFLFFNADLVQSPVKEGGSMAFVDDYTAWVVGTSANRNTRKIQRDILPKLEKWEKESGAVFESSKTAFIHFTRNTTLNRDSDMPLQFKQDAIQPVQSVKILGITMDQGLRYKEHLANKAEKAYKAALALKRLQGLSPSSMRQLFSATVAPIMDYGSPIWHLVVSSKVLSILNRAQRVAAQAITGGFRTMAINVAVIEAGIPSMQKRLLEQSLRFYIGIHKLDSSHIHAKLAKSKHKRRFASPLRKAAVMFKEIEATRAEKIPAVGCKPWGPKAHVYILDRDQAKLATVTVPGTIDFYTDGSVRNGKAGIGIWTSEWEASKTIKRSEDTNVHHTELEAIWTVIKSIPQDTNRSVRVRVFSDNQGALRSIKKPKSNDSLNLVLKIRERISRATFSLHWVPGHEGIKGNERANELAQEATRDTQTLPARAPTVPMSILYAKAKEMDYQPRNEGFYGAKTGKHLQKIDKALPGSHTKRMYNTLNRIAASILVQLRTNISRLNTYLYKIKVTETDKCECGATETVPHFLFCCPRWSVQRRDMRAAHGSRYCDLSYALGGYSIHEENGKKVDGEKDKWQPNLNAVKANIEFAKATGRLQRQI